MIFGDLGNDWLVGGTGRDTCTAAGATTCSTSTTTTTARPSRRRSTTRPTPHPTYEDLAYGGAGPRRADRQYRRRPPDRLGGEFNSYLVPFAPFGMRHASAARCSRSWTEFLYALSASDGADPTRGADEPAMTRRATASRSASWAWCVQQDFAWQDQTGAPDDPQPGNIPGGTRDVLRSANFNNITTSGDPTGTVVGFAADSGTWTVPAAGCRFRPPRSAATRSACSTSTRTAGVLRVQASINAAKPIAGWKANAYLIFDYSARPTSSLPASTCRPTSW